MQNGQLKLAIIGYGSMGKEIERIAHQQKLEITDIFDLDNPLSPEGNYNFDVAIDFTFPDSVLTNVQRLGKLKKNIVIGTTGWFQSINEIKKIAGSSGIGVVYGSNFSIGMQMFSRIVRKASMLANKIEDYDISLHEIHHNRKKDSPSGTALSLAEIILQEVERKKTILEDKSAGTIQTEQLHVSSMRLGEIAGTHTVYLDSFADTIELSHIAKNRSGFASGAITAAKWIHGRRGFFNFDEVINNIWGNE